MAEVPRNALGEHAEGLIADVLDKREEGIIAGVTAKLTAGETLDPQYAIQKWIELAEARRLRSKLIARSRVENARAARNQST